MKELKKTFIDAFKKTDEDFLKEATKSWVVAFVLPETSWSGTRCYCSGFISSDSSSAPVKKG